MRKISSSLTSERAARALLAALAALALAPSCGFDRGDRWVPAPREEPQPACELGRVECAGELLRRCEATPGALPSWSTQEDCSARGERCVAGLRACKPCRPGAARCDGQTIMRCDDDGERERAGATCAGEGIACRSGACANLCGLAASERSNVGCEYWAVDLDNAALSASQNAAAQQFALVVSNPEPDLPATVTITQDDSAPGEPPSLIDVATAVVPPLGLRVFKLGPREVDGSPDGEYDTGTHTALTRHAYRVVSTAPVVAYQFNPLENVNVFSNDASLLKPVEALTMTPGTLLDSYVVLGWPQTIASTDDPDTNFNPADPIDLRAFLTIVGTRAGTRVRVKSATAILAGGPVPATAADGTVEVTLEPFEVLNLETGGFNADFTGSIVSADQPVVVFSGGEASDAPYFSTLSMRRCCADHLEEQLDPVRTAGKRYVASVSANRTRAVRAAGGALGVVEQPEYFRVIATSDAGARLKTTLEGSQATIELDRKGAFTTITTTRAFMLTSDEPVMLANVSPSQDAAGVPRGLPGGDPSFLTIPPVEQFRSNYVFLTPDKYSFDFIRIIAPPGAAIVLDGLPLERVPGCEASPADGLTEKERGSAEPPFVIHTCQLSFPIVDPTRTAPDNLTPGQQNDGVHRIDASEPVGVLVDGFDAYVSYAYAAGTQLAELVPR
ncbi:MAG: IgGFc-binding protein [Sorangiineae bacterium]|nr:IgGFc-binding protein [Polyangiaceae bacterium]MEB2323951.1 IgGFc-binding protein [Sorangiineae bacterium]